MCEKCVRQKSPAKNSEAKFLIASDRQGTDIELFYWRLQENCPLKEE